MTSLLEIWMCLSGAALLGVLAGWLVWGRRTERIVVYYRGRLAKLRRNWETVEEGLAEELKRASVLERERDELLSELKRSQIDFESNHQMKEEAWRDERRRLEDAVQQLQERLIAWESGLQGQSPEMLLRPRRRPNRRSNPLPAPHPPKV